MWVNVFTRRIYGVFYTAYVIRRPRKMTYDICYVKTGRTYKKFYAESTHRNTSGVYVELRRIRRVSTYTAGVYGAIRRIRRISTYSPEVLRSDVFSDVFF